MCHNVKHDAFIIIHVIKKHDAVIIINHTCHNSKEITKIACTSNPLKHNAILILQALNLR